MNDVYGKDEFLKTIEILIKDQIESKNKLIPSALLEAQDGSDIDGFCKEFSKIVDNYKLFYEKGKKTFIVLNFPNSSNEIEYIDFYNYARQAAAITNRFYGVFVISLCRWNGKELVRSERYKELKEYIYKNRDNVCFVIHVLPEFEAKDVIYNDISKCVLLYNVKIGHPNENEAYDYACKILNDFGFSVDEKCVGNFKSRICKLIVNCKLYDGYRTLKACMDKMTSDMIITGKKTIDSELIEKYEKLMESMLDSCKENINVIGFRM